MQDTTTLNRRTESNRVVQVGLGGQSQPLFERWFVCGCRDDIDQQGMFLMVRNTCAGHWPKSRSKPGSTSALFVRRSTSALFAPGSTAALFARVNADPDPDHFVECAECGHLHYNTAFKLYADCPLAPECDCVGQDPIGARSDLTGGAQ